MNYLSICAGIEAMTVGCHHLSWKPVAFSEKALGNSMYTGVMRWIGTRIQEALEK